MFLNAEKDLGHAAYREQCPSPAHASEVGQLATAVVLFASLFAFIVSPLS